MITANLLLDIVAMECARLQARYSRQLAYSLKHSIENCSQTAAYGDMVTTDSL